MTQRVEQAPPPYVMVPIWLREKVGGSALIVYLTLASRSVGKNRCWPSLKRLQEDAGVSEPTLLKALNQLEDVGAIRRERRPNQSTVYHLDPYRADHEAPQESRATPPKDSLGSPPQDSLGSPPQESLGRKRESEREKGKEKHTGGDGSPPALILVPEPEGDPFDDWWAAYPRKTGKAAARKAYMKAVAHGVRPSLLLSALGWQAVKGQALNPDSGARYIPHPATWLNQERYADEPPSRAEAYAAMSAGDQGRLLMDLYDEAERQKGDTLTPGERQQIKQQLGGTG